jgi:translation elongation factor EF-1alpha
MLTYSFSGRLLLTCAHCLLDKFEPPIRLLDRPFRMAVSDFFKGGIGSSSGVSVAGRIDAGHVQVGEQVVAIPGGEIGVVKSKYSSLDLYNFHILLIYATL